MRADLVPFRFSSATLFSISGKVQQNQPSAPHNDGADLTSAPNKRGRPGRPLRELNWPLLSVLVALGCFWGAVVYVAFEWLR